MNPNEPVKSALLPLALFAFAVAPAPSAAAPAEKAPDAITQEDYAWWREARFGVFIHWNTSSLLALGAPKTIRRVNLFEKFNRIDSYELQAKIGGAWKTLARGTTMGLQSIELPKPVTVQNIRLVVKKYHSDNPTEGPGIRESDLF